MENKEIFVESPTGSGKSYQTALNCLFLCTMQNKPCIIATSSKILVDQYIYQLEKIYNETTIKGVKLSDTLISIVKHTKDYPLTSGALIEYFSKGKVIIVTVHSYLQYLDDFMTPSLFNSLINIFAPICNIRIDEGDVMLKNFYTSYPALTCYVRQLDSMRRANNPYYTKTWKNYSNVDDVIKIKQEGYEKLPSGSSGFYNINKLSSKEDNKENNLNFFKELPEYEDKHKEYSEDLKLILNENLKNNKFFSYPLGEYFISKKVAEDLNSKTYLLEINELIKKKYVLQEINIRMQNNVSLALVAIYDKIDPRKKDTLNAEYVKYLNSTNKDINIYNTIVKQLKETFVNSFTFLKMNLINDDKIKLKEHLKYCFQYYENYLPNKEYLFEIITFDKANDAFFKKILTSSECLLIYYFPGGLTADIEFNLTSHKNKQFNISIQNIKDKKFYSKSSFFEYAKNGSQHKNLIKEIMKVYNKNNKRSLFEYNEEIDLSSNNEGINEGENYKVNSFEIKKDILINSEKLSEKIKNSIYHDGEFIFSKNQEVINFSILLKKYENNYLLPFGMEIYLKNFIGLQQLTKGEIYYLSANFSQHNIVIHEEMNEAFCKYLECSKIKTKFTSIKSNVRCIDKLYILQSENVLFINSINKEFYQAFWENFFCKFYFRFSKKTKNIGMIAFPSQKKLLNFFSYFNFKKYVSMIMEGNEYVPQTVNQEGFDISKYSNKSILESKKAIQMLSIFSSITTGLNLPTLFYLHLSLNNFKPNKLNYPHSIKINNKYIKTDFFTIVESLIQIIGRLTRYKDSETYKVRFIDCKNVGPFIDMPLFSHLLPKLKDSFNVITFVKLEKYEKMVFSIKNSRNLKKYLSFYNNKIKEKNEDTLSLKQLGLYFSDFKIELIWFLKKNNHFSKKRSQYLFNKILLKYLKKCRLFAVKFILAEIYYKIIETKGNEDTLVLKKSFSFVLKNSFIKKIDAYSNLYEIFEIKVNHLKTIKSFSLNEFKENFKDELSDNVININIKNILPLYQIDLKHF